MRLPHFPRLVFVFIRIKYINKTLKKDHGLANTRKLFTLFHFVLWMLTYRLHQTGHLSQRP